MELTELRQYCGGQLGLQGPDAHIILIIPGRWGKTRQKRMFGRYGGPVGEIVGEASARMGLIVDFPAAAVLAYLDKHAQL